MNLPSEDVLRRIVAGYARLHAAHGVAIGRPGLVQPTGAFFPDEFRGDAASVACLLHRLTTYAPIADDLSLELAFIAPGETQPGQCGTVACCSPGEVELQGHGVEETASGYRVCISTSEVGHPNLLTASLARSLGAIVLYEAGDEVVDESAAEAAELAAVACGFGVLLLNGAEVWGKSCGGLRVAHATAFSVEELAVTLAMFLSLHEVKPSEARANLDASPRDAFDLAVSWMESNPRLVHELRERPALLDAGIFELQPVLGVLGRWRGRRQLEKELREGPSTSRAGISDEKRRRMEEARALIDEVFPTTKETLP